MRHLKRMLEHWRSKYWNLEHMLVPAQYVWILTLAILSPLVVWLDYIDVVKFTLCGLFFAGAALEVSGHLRYVQKGARIVALLALSIGLSFTVFYLAVGFLVSALTSPSPPVTFTLLFIYSSFAAVGAAKFFNGLFVFIGAKRGWIEMDVLKLPWLR